VAQQQSRGARVTRAKLRERNAWLRGLYEREHMSLSEIESNTGIPRTTVRHALKSEGVKMRSRGTPRGRWEMPEDDIRRAVFLYCVLKLSVSEAAEVMGIDQSGVIYRLRRANVTRRSRGESARLRYRRRPQGRQVPLGVSLA
jgi:predicted transcriptional regulator